jgi:hypothetical protein
VAITAAFAGLSPCVAARLQHPDSSRVGWPTCRRRRTSRSGQPEADQRRRAAAVHLRVGSLWRAERPPATAVPQFARRKPPGVPSARRFLTFTKRARWARVVVPLRRDSTVAHVPALTEWFLGHNPATFSAARVWPAGCSVRSPVRQHLQPGGRGARQTSPGHCARPTFHIVFARPDRRSFPAGSGFPRPVPCGQAARSSRLRVAASLRYTSRRRAWTLRWRLDTFQRFLPFFTRPRSS